MTDRLSSSLWGKWPICRFLTGFLLFSGAYALINQLLLTQSILYRAAAYDYVSAGLATLSFTVQAITLLAATVLLPRRWFIALLALTTISASVNVIYGQIVGDILDLQKTGWLLTEARQAGEAAAEFAAPLALALGKLMIALALLVGTRRLLHDHVRRLTRDRLAGKTLFAAIIALVVAPSFLWTPLGLHPLAAERNVYSFAATIWTADPPPPRALVTQVPDKKTDIVKIVWLIDESISYDGFTTIIRPDLAAMGIVDFGEAASMGHCSTPSNVALRSGVNVRSVSNKTDLRRTPSIWGYAAKAGYATQMIDGQVSGPPQNQLLAPEQALIDDYQNAAQGIRTDLAIARLLNARLKNDDKQFTYAILRGVHFQYRDHYPEGALPEGSSTQAQYEKAISYSKDGFFETLLQGVDRSKVAIFYASDHGQHIKDGITPHCSGSPVASEFAVPLIAFLPPQIQQRYAASPPGGRSLSQLFPTTLTLMGYDTAYASQNYDNILTMPTARYVWFGRGIVPVKSGGTIDIQAGTTFPAR